MKELFAALAAAQGEFPPIPRNKTVQVRMKSGGGYTFSYARLETILGATRPALAKHGLAVWQDISADGHVLTNIAHSSGDVMNLAAIKVEPVDASPQSLGSALTYARRYSYTLALCLASDDDDDGGAAAGHETNTLKEPPKAPPRPSDDAVLVAARLTATKGSEAFRKAWAAYSQETRADLRQHITELQQIAQTADPAAEQNHLATQHDDPR